MVEYFDVGIIVNTHGVKGEVKVMPLTDDPQRFEILKWVYLDTPQGLKKVNITGVKYLKGMVLMKLQGIENMNAAELLKNTVLKVDRSNAVKLPEDSYFICDLISSEVYDIDGTLLGALADIIKTGSNDVYVVKSPGKNDLLIPALKSVVTQISIKDKKITVKLPEGLVENEV